MQIEFFVVFAVVLLALSLVAEVLAGWLRLPQAVILILLGAASAYVVVNFLGIDTGLRSQSFHDLIFYVFLPILIFEAAYRLPLDHLLENVTPVLFLAVIGTLLTTVLSAVLIYFGIGHPTGFPWIAALLAGALLAATDPIAVIAQLKPLGAPERISVVLEGESLFNDAIAIVIFTIFLTLAVMPSESVGVSDALFEFVRVFAGGAIIGTAIGALAAWVLQRHVSPLILATLTLVVAYGAYLFAELAFHVSGIAAALFAGIFIARRRNQLAEDTCAYVDHLWDVLAYVANGSVFLLVGVVITWSMFTERWLAMLIAIVGVIIARIVVVHGGFALLNLFLRERLPMAHQLVLTWGGLRGAVTLGLALALPTTLDYWFTIQAMAFGVVLFTLFIQAPTMPSLVKRLGLSKTS